MTKWVLVGLAVVLLVTLVPIAVSAGAGTNDLSIMKEAIKGLIALVKLQYCADGITALC